MASINELYASVFEKLVSVQTEYENAENQLRAAKDQDLILKQKRIENLQSQLGKIVEYEEKVEYFRQMATKRKEATHTVWLSALNYLEEFTKDTNKVVISAEGYKDLVLEVGKDYKTVAIHKHTGGTATCTKKAVCEFCGEEYGEYASHNYGDKYEPDGTYHWKKCQNEGCDATTEKEEHKGGEATTTKRAVCEVCGAEYGGLKQEDSKPADKTTESKKDDTKPAEKPDKKTVKAKKVVVNKKRIVLKKGKKVKLKAKLKPANATEKVTFKSSNKKVAKVTKNGVVKAVKKGKCKITVKTASGKKAVVKVTVK